MPEFAEDRAYEREFRFDDDEPTPEGRKRAARAWGHQQQQRDEQEGPLWSISSGEQDLGPPVD
jgi:hypothetical protein